MTDIQDRVNYGQIDAHMSRLRYRRVPMSNIVNPVPVNVTSTQMMEWKLPANTVYNLAKSVITYQYTLPAGGATQFGFTFENNLDFAQWGYFGDGNQALMDVNYLDRLVSLTLPLGIKQDELTTRDSMNLMYANQSAGNYLPFSLDGQVGSVNSIVAPATTYGDVQYLQASSAAATPLTRVRQLELATLKGTFLETDRNLIFPKEMYLRFNTQFANRIGFYGTSNTNPSLAAAANTTAFTFTNVYLYLAVETNVEIIDSLRSSMKAGSIKYAIPYIVGNRQQFANTSNSTNFQVTMTKTDKRKVKEILFGSFCGLEASNTSFDHSNANGTKQTTITTSLDSVPLLDYPLNCYNPNGPTVAANGFNANSYFGDDYREMRKFLHKSTIENYTAYTINWVWVDAWGKLNNFDKLSREINDVNINDGLPMHDQDHIYTVTCDTPCLANTGSTTLANNGVVQYLFIKYQTNVRITPDGVGAFEFI